MTPPHGITVLSARCDKLKTHAKNTSESLSPITWLLKLFAINCNIDRETSCRARYLAKSLFIMVLLSSLNIFCLYYKFANVYNFINHSIRTTDAVQCIYDQCQYMVDLWFVYKYGRHISVNYFKLYECVDIIVGMPYFLEIKNKLLKLVSFFMTVWLLSSICDFVAWVYSYGYLIPMMYCVSYVYFLIKITTTLDLTSHVIHIEYRLKLIANVIEYYYLETESLHGDLSNAICLKNWMRRQHVQKSSSTENFIKRFSNETPSHAIKLLKRCYLLLTDQVEFINRIFGFRILLNSLSLLIDMIRFTNIGVRILLGTQTTKYYSGYLPVIGNIMRHFTCAAVLTSLVYHCENAYREKERVLLTIDHLLIHKKPDAELGAAMTELRQLIQDRPITFNMFNFFTLNYAFLTSISSVYVTYTIILLQSA